MEDMMKLIGVKPMKIIHGQMGPYFKLADGLSSNGEDIELFYKPSIKNYGYMDDSGKVSMVMYLEINLLWVGPTDFPDFEGGWSPLRAGSYHLEGGGKVNGVLIGKVFLPMGIFVGNDGDAYKWIKDHSGDIDVYLQSLIKQVNGTLYMPVKTVVEYIVEERNKYDMTIDKTEFFLNTDFIAMQAKCKSAVEKGG